MSSAHLCVACPPLEKRTYPTPKLGHARHMLPALAVWRAPSFLCVAQEYGQTAAVMGFRRVDRPKEKDVVENRAMMATRR